MENGRNGHPPKGSNGVRNSVFVTGDIVDCSYTRVGNINYKVGVVASTWIGMLRTAKVGGTASPPKLPILVERSTALKP